MKVLILLVNLFFIPAVAATITTATVGGTTTVKHQESAQTRDCQVQNGPGVIMFGLCYKEGDTVIFKSCADFTCKIDKDVVAGPVDAGQESCFTDKDPANFKTSALTEHKVSKISQIKDCGYGEKRKLKGEK